MGGKTVNDRDAGVLEQYELKVLNIYRGRVALICETDQGLKIMKELTTSKQKVEFEDQILRKIKNAGNPLADYFIRNKENEIVSVGKNNISYVVKDWYTGRECDLKKEEEISFAVKNLALVHNILKDNATDSVIVKKDVVPVYREDLEFIYERHNRELKKVRKYIREKRKKNSFELCLMNKYDNFISQGQEVLNKLQLSSYKTLWEESIRQGHIIHGDYNYHNILIVDKKAAITNFEKCSMGIQISDLYQFMRKVLEKQNWNKKVGFRMLEAYQEIKPITYKELENLYLQLSYPEKFWKIVNHYYNSNKSWISGKSVEKLEILVSQNEAKEEFLEALLQKL